MVYKLIYSIILVLSMIPLHVGQFLGKLLAMGFSIIPVERTAISLKNIQESLGDSIDWAESKRLNRKVLRHFGQMLFEVPHILRLNQKNLDQYMYFLNEKNLFEALKKERGVFILTAHFGNWELMCAAISLALGNSTVIARPFDFQPLDRLMNELRSRFGTEVVPKHRAMRKIMAAVKKNQAVGILLDQNVDWYDGVFVEFFGNWACTNKGLALIAMKTGTPVIPTFPVKQKDGRYCIVFEKEVTLINTGDKTRDVEENTALFTSIIEKYIKQYPDQWFWFHRRWKTLPYCKLPDDFHTL